jgi:transcriptional antiterminator Rof (Rho-off)
VARDTQHTVVALRTASSRVNEGVNGLVQDSLRRELIEHDLNMGSLEDLLIRVERETRQLALDQIRAVLHDRLQLDMPIRALPPGDQVEHVDALSRLAVLDTLPASQKPHNYYPTNSGREQQQDTPAGQLHADARKKRQSRDLVTHSQETRVEVDLGG